MKKTKPKQKTLRLPVEPINPVDHARGEQLFAQMRQTLATKLQQIRD